jgi:hypothetical protein
MIRAAGHNFALQRSSAQMQKMSALAAERACYRAFDRGREGNAKRTAIASDETAGRSQ